MNSFSKICIVTIKPMSLNLTDPPTPGAYIDETPRLPLSIASVETAMPAFIGYTETAPDEKEPGTTVTKPKKISSIFEYQEYFCLPGSNTPTPPETDIKVVIDMNKATPTTVTKPAGKYMPVFMMYYALQMFYKNGGRQCYIVSVGLHKDHPAPEEADLERGLAGIEKLFDVTLINFPDALSLPTAQDYFKLHNVAIQQCGKLKDRFAVMDVYMDFAPGADNIAALRTDISSPDPADLKYGAVYYPRIYTDLAYVYDEEHVLVTVVNDPTPANNFTDKSMDSMKNTFNNVYFMAQTAITNLNVLLPASSAALGIYAATDSSRGVWKAPANVNIANAVKPEIFITSEGQRNLNVDPQTGKSINVIRTFPGRGPAIIWGARTLTGNDNEWRYISVSRFFIMVETSVKNATAQFVFEPNDENTWTRIKAMIENYLTQQWKAGALMGVTTPDAFYVHTGLGQTMTESDILEGRLIIQIGLAAVRPAEFIILQFTHKMLSGS